METRHISTSEMTGQILVSTKPREDGSKEVSFVWHGGDIIGVSKALLDDIVPEYVQREGDLLIMGNLRVLLVAFDPLTEIYLADQVIP